MVAGMSAVPFDRANPRVEPHVPRWVHRPSRRVETGVWLCVMVCVVGLRWWVAAHLRTEVWTRDSGSYLAPAVAWLNGGQWVTSARRGPVYSLFLAEIIKLGGSLTTVADVQTVLGAFTTVATIALAREWLGRRALWPLAVCALFYAFYGMPIELERLIRNETLLAFFATVAFGAWFCALRTGSGWWLATSGFFTGLMQLLKGIFPIFPVIVVGLMAWEWRRRPRRAAAFAGTYLLLLCLPLVASKLYSRLSGTMRPAEPEDGQMFYGRTAQWTYLEPDGILPDIKNRIHEQAAAYAERFRRTGKLDNNEIVKRTVVPTLKTVIVDERGGTLVEVNRVGWRLGLEAVRHHPGAYLRQVGRDLFYLNFITAQRMVPFERKQLETSLRDAELYAVAKGTADPLTSRVFGLPQARAAIKEVTRTGSGLQRLARFITAVGRVRFLSPVFLTTLLLPGLVFLARDRQRLFWLGSGLLWYYYLILLSTVGRPLDRYMMPVVPIMFWTISTAAAWGWQYAFTSRHGQPETTSGQPSPSSEAVGVGVTSS